MVGEQEIERRRHHHLVTPGLAGNPAVFSQIVGGRGDDVRHRVDDVAAAVTVEIHGISLECRRHELGRPECACPRADQTVGPDVAALENFQRGQEFLAEIILPAADAGERRGGADHRTFAAKRAVIGFDAPDRGDGIAVDAVGPLHRVKSAAIFFKQRAALLDALVRHQDIEIVPERFGEFRLVVEQIHDPQIGRERARIGLEDASRNAAPRRRRPQPLDAAMEICRRRADRLGGHQRMAGSARFPAPFRRRLAALAVTARRSWPD